MQRFAVLAAQAAAGLLLLAWISQGFGAESSDDDPSRPSTFEIPFHPISLGVNINSALQNPLDGTGGDEQVRKQLAVVMNDLRAIGAKTARWFVTDVWPQWRCTSDPEDQQTGEIDPGWFALARALLVQADQAGINVVIVLGDLARGSMGFDGIAAAQAADREEKLRRWADHRNRLLGKDGYASENAPACSAHVGYYGATSPQQLFANPAFRAHLARRDTVMASFLSQFPALGALELFNEPDFNLTHTPEYWVTIRELEAAVRAAISPASQVPIVSGTAWWDPAIVQQATLAGVLPQEPYITVHNYPDYREGGSGGSEPELHDFVASLRGLIPRKPIVIAEIASSKPLVTLGENRRMIATLVRTYLDLGVGVWVWGNWFTEPDEHDYKWMFNDRSAAGNSFRPFFFNTEMERVYEKGRPIFVSNAKGNMTVRLEVSRISESEPSLRGRYALTVDGSRFVGFSRAGVFPQPFPRQPTLFADPPSTTYISDVGNNPRWAEVAYRQKGWILRVFTCNSNELQGGGTPTPGAVLGFAADRKRADFAACTHSRLEYSGRIGLRAGAS